MVLEDNPGRRALKFNIFQHAISRFRVSHDQTEFYIRQLGRLTQDIGRDGNFPQIMDGTGDADGLDLFLG